jgi:hypothetical protein
VRAHSLLRHAERWLRDTHGDNARVFDCGYGHACQLAVGIDPFASRRSKKPKVRDAQLLGGAAALCSVVVALCGASLGSNRCVAVSQVFATCMDSFLGDPATANPVPLQLLLAGSVAMYGSMARVACSAVWLLTRDCVRGSCSVNWLSLSPSHVAVIVAPSPSHIATVLCCVAVLQQRSPSADRAGPSSPPATGHRRRLQLSPRDMVAFVLQPYYSTCLLTTTKRSRCVEGVSSPPLPSLIPALPSLCCHTRVRGIVHWCDRVCARLPADVGRMQTNPWALQWLHSWSSLWAWWRTASWTSQRTRGVVRGCSHPSRKWRYSGLPSALRQWPHRYGGMLARARLAVRVP